MATAGAVGPPFGPTQGPRRQTKEEIIAGGFFSGIILELFRLLDWLLVLPDELEVAFRRKLTEYEEKQNMPHITSIERLRRQEGRVEGRVEGQMEALRTATLEILEARFGDVPC